MNDNDESDDLTSAEPEEVLDRQHFNVQAGAEMYAGLYEKPKYAPWENLVLWDKIMNDRAFCPEFIVPQKAIAGLNPAAVFMNVGLVKPGDGNVNTYVWQGFEEKPGFTLMHVIGTEKYALLLVLEDDVYGQALLNGSIQQGTPGNSVTKGIV